MRKYKVTYKGSYEVEAESLYEAEQSYRNQKHPVSEITCLKVDLIIIN